MTDYSNAESPRATVVITTKNRKDELRKAIASALEQDARPAVLVIDDGSTDGTSEMVRADFPSVRLERSERSLGYIAQRNRGAAMAATPVIFSIDDDAAFSTPRVVSQTLADFDDPRIGAVAIPFIDVNKDPGIKQRAPESAGRYLTACYIGTAHALQRELFVKLGGYREFLVHQGEEEDYCIRMLAAGYVVRLGRADAIHHFESPRRDFRRMDYYGRRNNILFVWCNVPLASLPGRLIGTTVNGIRSIVRYRRPWQMTRGMVAGYLGILKYWGQRKPVPGGCYCLNRKLLRGEKVELSTISNSLARN